MPTALVPHPAVTGAAAAADQPCRRRQRFRRRQPGRARPSSSKAGPRTPIPPASRCSMPCSRAASACDAGKAAFYEVDGSWQAAEDGAASRRRHAEEAAPEQPPARPAGQRPGQPATARRRSGHAPGRRPAAAEERQAGAAGAAQRAASPANRTTAVRAALALALANLQLARPRPGGAPERRAPARRERRSAGPHPPGRPAGRGRGNRRRRCAPPPKPAWPRSSAACWSASCSARPLAACRSARSCCSPPSALAITFGLLGRDQHGPRRDADARRLHHLDGADAPSRTSPPATSPSTRWLPCRWPSSSPPPSAWHWSAR